MLHCSRVVLRVVLLAVRDRTLIAVGVGQTATFTSATAHTVNLPNGIVTVFASELGSAYRISVNKGLDKNQNIVRFCYPVRFPWGKATTEANSVQKTNTVMVFWV